MFFKRSKANNVISHEEAKKRMASKDVIVLDVRTEQEFKAGHIAGSINLEIRQIPRRIQDLVSNPDQEILVYCLSGARSRLAAKALGKLGYSNVSDFGSLHGWPDPLVQ